MLLRGARDRLNADLQRNYGVCLTDMYEGRIKVSDTADFAVHLPRGGPVSEWFGGWGAITAEDEALRRIEFLIATVNSENGKGPAVPTPPVGLYEADRERRDKAAKAAAKRAALASMRSATVGGAGG